MYAYDSTTSFNFQIFKILNESMFWIVFYFRWFYDGWLLSCDAVFLFMSVYQREFEKNMKFIKLDCYKEHLNLKQVISSSVLIIRVALFKIVHNFYMWFQKRIIVGTIF